MFYWQIFCVHLFYWRVCIVFLSEFCPNFAREGCKTIWKPPAWSGVVWMLRTEKPKQMQDKRRQRFYPSCNWILLPIPLKICSSRTKILGKVYRLGIFCPAQSTRAVKHRPLFALGWYESFHVWCINKRQDQTFMRLSCLIFTWLYQLILMCPPQCWMSQEPHPHRRSQSPPSETWSNISSDMKWSLISSPSPFWAARDISCDVTIDQDGCGSRVLCRDIRSFFIFLRRCRDLAPSFSFKHQSSIKHHLGRKTPKRDKMMLRSHLNLHLTFGKNMRTTSLILLWTIWVVCILRHPNEKFLVFGHLWCLSICRDDNPVSTVRPWTLSPK